MIIDKKNIWSYLGSLRPKTLRTSQLERIKYSPNTVTFAPNHLYDLDLSENPLHWANLTRRIWSSHGVILAGGALVDLHLKKHPRDLDLYFIDQESVIMAVFAAYQTGYIMTEKAFEDIDKGVYQVVFEHPTPSMYPPLNFILHQFYKDAEHVISRFDLNICMISVQDGTGYTNQNWSYDFNYKKFKFHVVHHMITTQKRVFKYIEKGFIFQESKTYEKVEDGTLYY